MENKNIDIKKLKEEFNEYILEFFPEITTKHKEDAWKSFLNKKVKKAKTSEYKLSGLPKIIQRQEDGSYTVHDQIIHFIDGTKRTVSQVKWIWENEMIHLVTANEIEFIINRENVLFIQRRLNFGNDTL